MAQIPRLENPLHFPISNDILKELVPKAKDWALMHGACMRSKNNFSTDVINFAPFILTPSAFPRSEFKKAVEIQTILNELMHKVSLNFDFLRSSLAETIQVDDFTRRLFEIYETVLHEGVTQCISLGLLRSDYLMHNDSGNNIKQVEINTIACSFGGIIGQLVPYHRYVLQELDMGDKLVNLPENKALNGLCNGMLSAWKLYNIPKAAILFIIEDVTYNICDQRFHEFELRRLNPSVAVLRKTLTEIADGGKLGPKKQLLINGIEIAVVYFRAGYEPGHYPSEREWAARLMIERSLAIKSPSIQYHLAGTKKVQQALARGGTLELFLSDSRKIEMVKDVFTGLYSLDFDELGDHAVQMALDDPERFVLKPQREGGGNNVYGLDVKNKILEMRNSKERMGWILMERILPPVQTGYMIRPGDAELPNLNDLVSELGIFGVVIGDEKEIFVNEQVGHMLRTKISTANEAGVAAGSGALDSPYLID